MQSADSERGPKEAPYRYSPANFFHSPLRPSVLAVFPLVGKAVKVPLPFDPGYVAFSPDGKSLYATAALDPTKPSDARTGLLKIEFNPTRVSNVPGSLEFVIFSVAVSGREDKLVISGRRLENGGPSCGVFELNLSDGDARQIFRSQDCDYLSAWNDLNLSPDGERALALHNRRLELLDLVTGTSRPIGPPEFRTGAWAPNGKWIAALDNSRPSQLFLIDPNNLSLRRRLGGTDGGVHWSPDSRYLLLFRNQLLCWFYSYTIETLEISTGKRSVIPNSRCSIQGGASGWVDRANVR